MARKSKDYVIQREDLSDLYNELYGSKSSQNESSSTDQQEGGTANIRKEGDPNLEYNGDTKVYKPDEPIPASVFTLPEPSDTPATTESYTTEDGSIDYSGVIDKLLSTYGTGENANPFDRTQPVQEQQQPSNVEETLNSMEGYGYDEIMAQGNTVDDILSANSKVDNALEYNRNHGNQQPEGHWYNAPEGNNIDSIALDFDYTNPQDQESPLLKGFTSGAANVVSGDLYYVADDIKRKILPNMKATLASDGDYNWEKIFSLLPEGYDSADENFDSDIFSKSVRQGAIDLFDKSADNFIENSNWLDNVSRQNQLSKQQMQEHGLPWLLYSFGNGAGSSFPSLAATAALSMLPGLGEAGLAGRASLMLGRMAPHIPKAARAVAATGIFKTGGNFIKSLSSDWVGKWTLGQMVGNIPESAAEAGSAVKEATLYNQYAAQANNEAGYEKYKILNLDDVKGNIMDQNIGLLTTSDVMAYLVERAWQNKLIKLGVINPKMLGGLDKSWTATTLQTLGFSSIGALKEGLEEFFQNYIKDTNLNKKFDVDQAIEEFLMACVSGAILNGAGSAYSAKTEGIAGSVLDGHIASVRPAGEQNGIPLSEYKWDNKTVTAEDWFKNVNEHSKEKYSFEEEADPANPDRKFKDHKYGLGLDAATNDKYMEARLGLEFSNYSQRYAKDIYDEPLSLEDVNRTIQEYEFAKSQPDFNPTALTQRQVEELRAAANQRKANIFAAGSNIEEDAVRDEMSTTEAEEKDFQKMAMKLLDDLNAAYADPNTASLGGLASREFVQRINNEMASQPDEASKMKLAALWARRMGYKAHPSQGKRTVYDLNEQEQPSSQAQEQSKPEEQEQQQPVQEQAQEQVAKQAQEAEQLAQQEQQAEEQQQSTSRAEEVVQEQQAQQEEQQANIDEEIADRQKMQKEFDVNKEIADVDSYIQDYNKMIADSQDDSTMADEVVKWRKNLADLQEWRKKLVQYANQQQSVNNNAQQSQGQQSQEQSQQEPQVQEKVAEAAEQSSVQPEEDNNNVIRLSKNGTAFARTFPKNPSASVKSKKINGNEYLEYDLGNKVKATISEKKDLGYKVNVIHNSKSVVAKTNSKGKKVKASMYFDSVDDAMEYIGNLSPENLSVENVKGATLYTSTEETKAKKKAAETAQQAETPQQEAVSQEQTQEQAQEPVQNTSEQNTTANTEKPETVNNDNPTADDYAELDNMREEGSVENISTVNINGTEYEVPSNQSPVKVGKWALQSEDDNSVIYSTGRKMKDGNARGYRAVLIDTSDSNDVTVRYGVLSTDGNFGGNDMFADVQHFNSKSEAIDSLKQNAVEDTEGTAFQWHNQEGTIARRLFASPIYTQEKEVAAFYQYIYSKKQSNFGAAFDVIRKAVISTNEESRKLFYTLVAALRGSDENITFHITDDDIIGYIKDYFSRQGFVVEHAEVNERGIIKYKLKDGLQQEVGAFCAPTEKVICASERAHFMDAPMHEYGHIWYAKLLAQAEAGDIRAKEIVDGIDRVFSQTKAYKELCAEATHGGRITLTEAQRRTAIQEALCKTVGAYSSELSTNPAAMEQRILGNAPKGTTRRYITDAMNFIREFFGFAPVVKDRYAAENYKTGNAKFYDILDFMNLVMHDALKPAIEKGFKRAQAKADKGRTEAPHIKVNEEVPEEEQKSSEQSKQEKATVEEPVKEEQKPSEQPVEETPAEQPVEEQETEDVAQEKAQEQAEEEPSKAEPAQKTAETESGETVEATTEEADEEEGFDSSFYNPNDVFADILSRQTELEKEAQERDAKEKAEQEAQGNNTEDTSQHNDFFENPTPANIRTEIGERLLSASKSIYDNNGNVVSRFFGDNVETSNVIKDAQGRGIISLQEVLAIKELMDSSDKIFSDIEVKEDDSEKASKKSSKKPTGREVNEIKLEAVNNYLSSNPMQTDYVFERLMNEAEETIAAKKGVNSRASVYRAICDLTNNKFSKRMLDPLVNDAISYREKRSRLANNINGVSDYVATTIKNSWSETWQSIQENDNFVESNEKIANKSKAKTDFRTEKIAKFRETMAGLLGVDQHIVDTVAPKIYTDKFSYEYKHEALPVYLMMKAFNKGHHFLLAAGAGYGKTHAAIVGIHMAAQEEFHRKVKKPAILITGATMSQMEEWVKAAQMNNFDVTARNNDRHVKINIVALGPHDANESENVENYAPNNYTREGRKRNTADFEAIADQLGKVDDTLIGDYKPKKAITVYYTIYTNIDKIPAVKNTKWQYVFSDERHEAQRNKTNSTNINTEALKKEVISEDTKVCNISATPFPYSSNIAQYAGSWFGMDYNYKAVVDLNKRIANLQKDNEINKGNLALTNKNSKSYNSLSDEIVKTEERILDLQEELKEHNKAMKSWRQATTDLFRHIRDINEEPFQEITGNARVYTGKYESNENRRRVLSDTFDALVKFGAVDIHSADSLVSLLDLKAPKDGLFFGADAHLQNSVLNVLAYMKRSGVISNINKAFLRTVNTDDGLFAGIPTEGDSSIIKANTAIVEKQSKILKDLNLEVQDAQEELNSAQEELDAFKARNAGKNSNGYLKKQRINLENAVSDAKKNLDSVHARLDDKISEVKSKIDEAQAVINSEKEKNAGFAPTIDQHKLAITVANKKKGSFGVRNADDVVKYMPAVFSVLKVLKHRYFERVDAKYAELLDKVSELASKYNYAKTAAEAFSLLEKQNEVADELRAYEMAHNKAIVAKLDFHKDFGDMMQALLRLNDLYNASDALDEALDKGENIMNQPELLNVLNIRKRNCAALFRLLQEKNLIFGNPTKTNVGKMYRTQLLTEENVGSLNFKFPKAIKGSPDYSNLKQGGFTLKEGVIDLVKLIKEYDNKVNTIDGFKEVQFALSPIINSTESDTTEESGSSMKATIAFKQIVEMVKTVCTAQHIADIGNQDSNVILVNFVQTPTENLFKWNTDDANSKLDEIDAKQVKHKDLYDALDEYKKLINNHKAAVALVDDWLGYSKYQIVSPICDNISEVNSNVSNENRSTIYKNLSSESKERHNIIATSDTVGTGLSLHETIANGHTRTTHFNHPRNIFLLGVPKTPSSIEQQANRIFRSGSANDVTVQIFTLGTKHENASYNKNLARGAITSTLSHGIDTSGQSLNYLEDYRKAVYGDQEDTSAIASTENGEKRSFLTAEDYASRTSLNIAYDNASESVLENVSKATRLWTDYTYDTSYHNDMESAAAAFIENSIERPFNEYAQKIFDNQETEKYADVVKEAIKLLTTKYDYGKFANDSGYARTTYLENNPSNFRRHSYKGSKLKNIEADEIEKIADSNEAISKTVDTLKENPLTLAYIINHNISLYFSKKGFSEIPTPVRKVVARCLNKPSLLASTRKQVSLNVANAILSVSNFGVKYDNEGKPMQTASDKTAYVLASEVRELAEESAVRDGLVTKDKASKFIDDMLNFTVISNEPTLIVKDSTYTLKTSSHISRKINKEIYNLLKPIVEYLDSGKIRQGNAVVKKGISKANSTKEAIIDQEVNTEVGQVLVKLGHPTPETLNYWEILAPVLDDDFKEELDSFIGSIIDDFYDKLTQSNESGKLHGMSIVDFGDKYLTSRNEFARNQTAKLIRASKNDKSIATYKQLGIASGDMDIQNFLTDTLYDGDAYNFMDAIEGMADDFVKGFDLRSNKEFMKAVKKYEKETGYKSIDVEVMGALTDSIAADIAGVIGFSDEFNYSNLLLANKLESNGLKDDRQAYERVYLHLYKSISDRLKAKDDRPTASKVYEYTDEAALASGRTFWSNPFAMSRRIFNTYYMYAVDDKWALRGFDEIIDKVRIYTKYKVEKGLEQVEEVKAKHRNAQEVEAARQRVIESYDLFNFIKSKTLGVYEKSQEDRAKEARDLYFSLYWQSTMVNNKIHGTADTFTIGDEYAFDQINKSLEMEDDLLLDHKGTFSNTLSLFAKACDENKQARDFAGKYGEGNSNIAAGVYFGTVMLYTRYMAYEHTRPYLVAEENKRMQEHPKATRKEIPLHYTLPKARDGSQLTIEEIMQCLKDAGWEFGEEIGTDGKTKLTPIIDTKHSTLTDEQKADKNVPEYLKHDHRILGGRKNDIFKDALEAYRELHRNIEKLLVHSGCLGKELYQAIDYLYPDYCPLNRAFGKDEQQSAGSLASAVESHIPTFHEGPKSGGMANIRVKLHQALKEGSDKPIQNVVESSLLNIAGSISCAIRNDTMRRIVGTMIKAEKEVKEASKIKLKFSDNDELANLDDIDPALRMIFAGNTSEMFPVKYFPMSHPHPDPDSNVFTVMIMGKKVPFQTQGEAAKEIYQAITNLSSSIDPLFGPLGIFARALRFGSTANPFFGSRNSGRDTFSAAVYSKDGFIPVWDSLLGAWKQLTSQESSSRYMANGIASSNFWGNPSDAYRNIEMAALHRNNNENWASGIGYDLSDTWHYLNKLGYKEFLKDFIPFRESIHDRTGNQFIKEFLERTEEDKYFRYRANAFRKKLFKHFNPFDDTGFLLSLSEMFESATREGVYDKALKGAEKKIRIRGNAKQEAAARIFYATHEAVENTVNFGRHGSSDFLRTYCNMTAFLNAQIQGLARYIRAFQHPWYMLGKLFYKYLTVDMAMLMWDYYDDPEKRMRVQRGKRYSTFMMPWGNTYMFTPKPQEFISASALLEGAFDAWYLKDPKAMKAATIEAVSNVVPFGVPTFLAGTAEWGLNHSFFSGRPLESYKQLLHVPENRTAISSTVVSQYLADEAVNKPVLKNLDVSPIKIDNLARSQTGSLGMFALNELPWIIKAYAKFRGEDYNKILGGKTKPDLGSDYTFFSSQYWMNLNSMGTYLSDYHNMRAELRSTIERKGPDAAAAQKVLDNVDKFEYKLPSGKKVKFSHTSKLIQALKKGNANEMPKNEQKKYAYINKMTPEERGKAIVHNQKILIDISKACVHKYDPKFNKRGKIQPIDTFLRTALWDN